MHAVFKYVELLHHILEVHQVIESAILVILWLNVQALMLAKTSQHYAHLLHSET